MTELAKLITVFGREYGIGVMLITQSAFTLDPYILDNASCVFCFSTGHVSMPIIQRAMNLIDEEVLLLQKCPKRVCAVLKRSASPLPYLLEIPAINIPSVSKEQRDLLMQNRIKEMREKYLRVFKETIVDEIIEDHLDADKIHILKDYANSPYESVTEKASKLNYSAPTLVRHLKELQEHGFVVQEEVAIGKGVGVIKLYKLTSKAIEQVGKMNLVGKGSLGHGFFMRLIKKYFEQNGIQN